MDRQTPDRRRSSTEDAFWPRVRTRVALGVLCLGIPLLVGTIAMDFVRRQEARLLEGTARELESVGALKAIQIAAWIEERGAYLSMLEGNPATDRLLIGALAHSGDPQRQRIAGQLLVRLQKAFGIARVDLLDAQGDIRLRYPASAAPLAAPVRDAVTDVLRTGGSRRVGTYRGADDGREYFGLVVPIGLSDGRKVPAGALVARFDPQQHLYPMLMRWPLRSQSAEAFLARRDGDEVVYLNPLRFLPDHAWPLRLPLTHAQLPIVQAIHGRRGFVAGHDYRGVPVLADVREVAGTDWYLVVRIDRDEALAPGRGEMLRIGALAASVTVAGLLAVALLWSGLRRRQLEERYHAALLLRERDERLRLNAAAFDAVRDAVVVTDLEARILSVNPAFTELTGYTEEEVRGRNPSLLRSPQTPVAVFREMWADLIGKGRWSGEIVNRARDGQLLRQWLTIVAVRDESGEPTHYVGVSTDVTMLREAFDRIEQLLFFDPGTGMANLSRLRAQIAAAMERAQDRGLTLALITVHLSGMGRIRDGFGNEQADKVIAECAARITSVAPRRDLVARTGPVEFRVLIEDCETRAEVELIAARLLAVAGEPLPVNGSGEAFLVASIGVALFPQDALSAEEILTHSGAACRAILEAGGGDFVFFDRQMNATARRRIELRAKLHYAIERGEFSLHYQPQADLASGRTSGLEALLRWRTVDGEQIGPGEFIQVAESTGMIDAIGAWVIDEACRQLREWADAGIPIVPVSVNVSAVQLERAGIVGLIDAALARHGVASRWLTVELTETALVGDPSAAAQLLRQLRELGISISLDDFGTGQSSLAYLHQFPFDFLKVNAAFVDQLTAQPPVAAIVTTIIALAKSIGASTIAECVETEEQLAYLREIGCDAIQGYLFSRPMPAEACAEFLRAGRSLELSRGSPAGAPAQE